MGGLPVEQGRGPLSGRTLTLLDEKRREIFCLVASTQLGKTGHGNSGSRSIHTIFPVPSCPGWEAQGSAQGHAAHSVSEPTWSSDLRQVVWALDLETEGLCVLGQLSELNEPMCETGMISNTGIKHDNISQRSYVKYCPSSNHGQCTSRYSLGK